MSSFRKLIPVTRTAPGNYNIDGIWVEGASESLSIKMSVQPLRLDEMDALPEGRRSSRAVKIYAESELYAVEQTTRQNADIITWLGKSWEVVGCEAYQMGVIPHFKALAVEVKGN